MHAETGVVSNGLLQSIASHERAHGKAPTLRDLGEATGIPGEFIHHLEKRLLRELGAGRVSYHGGRWRLTTAGHARSTALGEPAL